MMMYYVPVKLSILVGLLNDIVIELYKYSFLTEVPITDRLFQVDAESSSHGGL
jgi:hypothetical protein